jgi:chromosome segregation ATPase
MSAEVGMTEISQILEEMRAFRAELKEVRTEMHAELKEIRTEMHVELEAVHKRLDGLPILHRHLKTTQDDIRSLTGAFRDFARDNATKGEIDAVHADLERVHDEYLTLATQTETNARHIREIQDVLRRD